MQMDRETLTLVATIVAIVGVIFLFREMNKAKADVENLKNFSAHLIHRLNTQEPTPRETNDEDEAEPEAARIAEEKEAE